MRIKERIRPFILSSLFILLSPGAFAQSIIANNTGHDIYLRIRSGELKGIIKRLSQGVKKSIKGNEESLMINNETFLLKKGTAVTVDALEFPLRLRGWWTEKGYIPTEDVTVEGVPSETSADNVKNSGLAFLVNQDKIKPETAGIIFELGEDKKAKIVYSSNAKYLRTFLGDKDEKASKFVLSGYFPADIEKFDEERLLGTCAICLDSLDAQVQETVSTVCNHVFHKECMKTWGAINHQCPQCRHDHCMK